MFVFGKSKHQSFYNLQGKCTAFFGNGLLMVFSKLERFTALFEKF